MPTNDELVFLQRLPLELKVAKTQARIREWINHFGEDGVYVSFSGGKDSTVLLDIVRKEYPSVKAVFVNTGLEFPEIQKFVKSFDNVDILKPEMTFIDVIKTYGYPFISKDISEAVYEGRIGLKNGKHQHRIAKLNGELLDKNGEKSPYNAEKYKPLLYTDFILSHKCCKVMKKKPIYKYEKENNVQPLIATMTCESRIRHSAWLKQGCNAFDNKRPISNPMSFWTEQDVLQYIKQNNLKIADVYGDIVQENLQYSLFEEDCKLCTTGCYRTGCIFCGFGCHLDKYSRFLRLKETHPKQYNFCMNGGGLRL